MTTIETTFDVNFSLMWSIIKSYFLKRKLNIKFTNPIIKINGENL